MNKPIGLILQSVKCLSVFAALSLLFTLVLHSLILFSVLKFGIDVYDDSGLHHFFVASPWVNVLACSMAGLLTFILQRKQYLTDGRRNGRKIVVASALLSFPIFGLPHGLMRQIEKSPLRLKKLVKTFGPKVDPCLALSRGMSKEDAGKVMGKEISEPYHYVEQGKKVYDVYFESVAHPSRPVTFDEETSRIVGIKCFDGTYRR